MEGAHKSCFNGDECECSCHDPVNPEPNHEYNASTLAGEIADVLASKGVRADEVDPRKHAYLGVSFVTTLWMMADEIVRYRRVAANRACDSDRKILASTDRHLPGVLTRSIAIARLRQLESR